MFVAQRSKASGLQLQESIRSTASSDAHVSWDSSTSRIGAMQAVEVRWNVYPNEYRGVWRSVRACKLQEGKSAAASQLLHFVVLFGLAVCRQATGPPLKSSV